MVGLPSRILERGRDIAPLKQREICKDFLPAGACCQQVKHVRDANSQPTQARPAATLAGINGNAMRFAHLKPSRVRVTPAPARKTCRLSSVGSQTQIGLIKVKL